jgi:mono/diheme cytochrome c family protein
MASTLAILSGASLGTSIATDPAATVSLKKTPRFHICPAGFPILQNLHFKNGILPKPTLPRRTAMTPNTLAHRARILLIGAMLATVSSTALLLMADDADNTAWTAPARAKRTKNPVASDAKSMAAGKDVYAAQCLECHGETGKGDGSSGKGLSPKPTDLTDPNVIGQADGTLFWKITNGRNHMPAFESLTAENDRWNAINFLRALARPASSQPAGTR